jgi:hypothetical protein
MEVHACWKSSEALHARSNRSVALLKLKKIAKAMEDAEECIRLRPEWEKGYIRKAGVHEAQENMAVRKSGEHGGKAK